MGAAAAIDPPELIAASGIHPNGIGEWPMKLRWSASMPGPGIAEAEAYGWIGAVSSGMGDYL
eukprot:scaffold114447_cov34-Cyclotella_meneghiniana.AAC.1